ncbi:MAG: hypothetical protein NTV49_12945 [Kiritimatiellaeota bacterium]|nr:hypothetical protein [Kiritimatiellota bacterium]
MRRKLYLVVGICAWLCVPGGQAGLASDAGNSACGREPATRVAVIDHGGAHELCTLLERRLAEDKNWQLFSRGGYLLGAVVAEKNLQLLIDEKDWGALSKLTRVGMLVLAGKSEDGKIWARVVSIPHASVLTETWFNQDPSQIDVQVSYLKSLLDRDRSKLGLTEGKVVNLSVGSVAASTADFYMQMLEQPLKSRLLHRLANDPSVILNERRNLDNVVWERSLDAALKTAPPTGQTALSCNLARQGLEMRAQMALLFPGGRSLERVFTTTLESRDGESLSNRDLVSRNLLLTHNEELHLDAMSEAIVHWVIQSCMGDKAGRGSDAFSAEAEAEYYARQAKFLATCGMASQGAAAGDAAWALGHRTPELLRHSIMAHAMSAFPQWDGLQDWDLSRPPQSGRYGNSYNPIPLTREPWRVTEAIRTAELLRMYLYLYKDQKSSGFDDDPRIIGARCLYNALCVLMSAYELELDKDTVYSFQISTLRSLIAGSAEELLRMPRTYNSAALYYRIAPFIPAWAEPLNKRMEIWDLYLDSPQQVALHGWMRWAGQEGFGYGLNMWTRGFRGGTPSSVPWIRKIEDKGNPVGMVFPWEPNSLQRRKQLLSTFVAMTRSPDTKRQDKGWTLWLLWWRNEINIRREDRFVSQFDHDYPDFNYIEEAREAWGAPKEVDFRKWIEAKQTAYAQELKPRLAKIFTTAERLFTGLPVIPTADIRFYQWYLREIVLRDWINEQKDSIGPAPYHGPSDLYILPKSVVNMKPVTVEMKKPELSAERCSYIVDGDTVYVLHLQETGRVSRLDPVGNKLLAADIPEEVQAGVDTTARSFGDRALWAGVKNVTISLGERVSWLIGDKRFAYRLGQDGDWHIEDLPGGTPVVLHDRLYFLASGNEGYIDLQTNSMRYGALYEFNPLGKETKCLFSTRRFPPRTILDAREPANPVAVFSSSQGVMHMLVAEEQGSLWSVFRCMADGDFEKINAVTCPRISVGSVYSCGGHSFLQFKARASNPPYCYWTSWAMLDGDSPDGLRLLWQDPRIATSSLPFPAEIPAGREKGPYVRRGVSHIGSQIAVNILPI